MKRVLAAFVLGMCVSACGGNSSSSTPTPTPTPSRVIGLSGNLAFGNVAVGQNASSTLTITNSGNSTLTVSGMTGPGGGVYTSSFTSGTIAAGGSQPSTIRFAPTAGQTYSGTLTVTGDQTSGTNTISVSGAGAVPRFTIAGVISDSSTGSPISGATVTAINVLTDTNVGSSTDGNGYYSLPGVASGIVNLDWLANGYVSQAERGTFTADTRRDIRLIRQVAPTRTRIGAICNDGTTSDATGSGACSSHGGVRCWRYSDGTCTNP